MYVNMHICTILLPSFVTLSAHEEHSADFLFLLPALYFPDSVSMCILWLTTFDPQCIDVYNVKDVYGFRGVYGVP